MRTAAPPVAYVGRDETVDDARGPWSPPRASCGGGAVTTDLSAKDAQTAIDHLREQVDAHHAVGDLDALRARLDKLVESVEARREERKQQRAKQSDEARHAKEALVAEAEELARSEQWRTGGGGHGGLV